MFNLDQAISDWRCQMQAAGVKAHEVLDELEGHLREDLEEQMQSGLTAQEAFEIAIRRIGQPVALQHEFAKVGGRKRALLRRLRELFVQSLFPFPSLSAFSTSARQTLARARLEAPRLHHDFVGTEHLLLGLLTLEVWILPNVLKRMNVDREALRKEIEQWVSGFRCKETMDSPPYTPRARKALSLAAREAKGCDRAPVSDEHIFLGLLLEGDGVAGRVLKGFGVNARTARKEILKQLHQNQGN